MKFLLSRTTAINSPLLTSLGFQSPTLTLRENVTDINERVSREDYSQHDNNEETCDLKPHYCLKNNSHLSVQSVGADVLN